VAGGVVGKILQLAVLDNLQRILPY
jgi:hypothetical protein